MGEHYYTEKPTSKLKINEFSAKLRNITINFKSGSGTFSIRKIDTASEILINNSIINKEDVILDLGCGYGAIAVAIKKAFPYTTVYGVDINERALKLAKDNAKINHTNIIFFKSNVFEKVTQKFDTILTNPPHNAGRDVVFKFLTESKDHLKENGTLQVVARHQKGGKQIEKKMEEVFGNVETVVKKSGFRIYLSKKE